MSEMSPEVAAQLAEQKKNCIFCKIIAGEMQGKKVYEDKLMIGILDINPCAKGHILLLPKEHYPIMPFIPPETFQHMFGKLPKIIDAIKKAMLVTGFNVIIANGGVAGQQSPHFLIHLIPREKGDELDKYAFDTMGTYNQSEAEQINSMIGNNLPIMIRNHFQRVPAEWHTGKYTSAEFLSEIKSKETTIYEDEKSLAVLPSKPKCLGHITIYSNEEPYLFENLDELSAFHLFYVASFAATTVFEGMKAHGSNIILKTGTSQDNPTGRLSLHILPRFSEDGIDIINPPMQNKPNLDETQSKIKDKTFVIEHADDDIPKQREIIDLDKKSQNIEVIDQRTKNDSGIGSNNNNNQPNFNQSNDPMDELKKAIKKIQEN